VGVPPEIRIAVFVMMIMQISNQSIRLPQGAQSRQLADQVIMEASDCRQEPMLKTMV